MKFKNKADLRNCLKSAVSYANLSCSTDPMDLQNFVVIDTETTGLDAVNDEIIDVAAIRFRSGVPERVFSKLVKPSKRIPAAITAVNHITNGMVAGRPSFESVLPELEEFCFSNGEPVIGQNISFDLGFLVNQGMTIPANVRFYDTLLISRRCLVPRFTGHYDAVLHRYVKTENPVYDIEDHKLATLCRYYGVELIDAHRAENDALATGKLFVAMGKQIKGE